MRKIGPLIIISLAASTAWAVPPSSTLSGPNGKLVWTVTETADGVEITGSSHKWKVAHKATKSLKPIETTHTNADGTQTRVVYSATGAKVILPDKTFTVDEAGLWDADAVDIRLAQAVIDGKPKLAFRAIDPATGDVYGFDTKVEGQDKCGEEACVHIKLSMTGAYRLVGPKWHYWFASDGRLLRFEGPIGEYKAAAKQ